jgi:hypothetical protein
MTPFTIVHEAPGLAGPHRRASRTGRLWEALRRALAQPRPPSRPLETAALQDSGATREVQGYRIPVDRRTDALRRLYGRAEMLRGSFPL